MRVIPWFITGMLVFALAQSVHAASLVAPPIDELLSAPDLTRVAAVTAGAGADASPLKFTVTERISGNSPDELVLRAQDSTAADTIAGARYIVAWTDQRKIPLFRGGYEPDPDGPKIVQVRGLSTDALYEDTPEIRFLFASRHAGDELDAGRQIDALLKQALRDDTRSRDLVVGQLYFSPHLGEQMSREQADTLRNILGLVDLSTLHRDYLLQVARRLPVAHSSPWLAEEFRKVILFHGSQHDLNSFVPQLVKTSAEGLRQVGEPADVALLSFLLYANNPGVSKAALAAMDHLDSQEAHKQAERALQRGWVEQQTRRALEKYLVQ